MLQAYQIRSSKQIILRQFQIKDKNQLLGIPLSIALKPNIYISLNSYNKELKYYSVNTTVKDNIGFPLTKTLLKYHLDLDTEYQSIDKELYPLAKRKEDIIKNINNVDSSIIDLAPYNLLHNTFFLQLLQ